MPSKVYLCSIFLLTHRFVRAVGLSHLIPDSAHWNLPEGGVYRLPGYEGRESEWERTSNITLKQNDDTCGSPPVLPQEPENLCKIHLDAWAQGLSIQAFPQG